MTDNYETLDNFEILLKECLDELKVTLEMAGMKIGKSPYDELIAAHKEDIAVAVVAELKSYTGIASEIPESEILARVAELEK